MSPRRREWRYLRRRHPLRRPRGVPIVNRKLAVLAFILSFAFPTGTALAQCATWLPSSLSGPGNGSDGKINCFLNWDPDGSGPDPTWLVVGGEFGSIDGVPADNIAAWDGLVWRALGFGTNGPVHSLADWNGQLIVGGEFTAAGNLAVRSVARYTAGAWSPMGSGLSFSTFQTGRVYALTVFNGTLFAGGGFSVSSRCIAAWNGSDWVSTGNSPSGTVSCFVAFNGALLVGGSFGGVEDFHVYQYNGTNSWTVFQPGLTYARPRGVRAMAVVSTALWVAADFLYDSGDKIARFDLNMAFWNDIAGGPCNPRALYNRGGVLHAAGGNCNPGQTGQRVQYYAGGQWWSVSNGLGGPGGFIGQDEVHALGDYGGYFVAGGNFVITPGDWRVGIAQYNGATWSVPKAASSVAALRQFGTKMMVGGSFSTATPAGQAYHLATWDGSRFAQFPGPNAPVFTFYDYTDTSFPFTKHLVIGGAFNKVGNIATRGIAVWNETSDMPPSWSALGSGFNNAVLAIEPYRGRMVAGGLFTASGSTTTSRVARLSGSAWTAMGTGMNGTVRALKAYTDRDAGRAILVAGGDFTLANGGAVNYIAGWSESLTGGPNFGWGPFGGGFNAPVYALEYFNGSLYAAGNFTAHTTGTALSHIARNTSSGWVRVGTNTAGGGLDGNVTSMRIINGALYVTGTFTHADGIDAFRIARWDGATWSGVGGGTSGTVLAAGQFGSEVMAGGDFDQAGSVQSWSLARYSASGAPWIVQQPAARSVSEGATASFTIEPASGYGGVACQWQRNGVPIANGLTPGGTTVTGATSAMLLLTNTARADSGNYACVVSNGCGAATSAAAKLTVNVVSGVGDIPGAGRLELAALRAPGGAAARLAWTVPIDMTVRLDVFDVLGRRVATLFDGRQERGSHESLWRAMSDGGPVSPGIYFARLTGGGATVTRKVVVVEP
jgi:hypothetical protein